MKRIRLLILLSVLAVALPVGLLSGVAKATGGSGTRAWRQLYAVKQTLPIGRDRRAGPRD